MEEIWAEAIDLHVHAGPGVFPRKASDLALALAAKEAGIGGFVLKAHEGSTLERAEVLREAVPGLKVFGCLVLNHFVGGFNPAAVELALGLGARLIWMPTISARHHLFYYGGGEYDLQKARFGFRSPGEGLSIFGAGGKILPAVEEILRLIAEKDAALATGHLAPAEVFALVRAAKEAGVKKILVAHPELPLTSLPLSAQEELARQGAYLEKSFLTLLPGWGGVSLDELAAGIRSLGAAHCVLQTDLGQVANPHPVEGMHRFLCLLKEAGLSKAELSRMAVENPRFLLGV